MKKTLLSELSKWLQDVSSDSPCGGDFVDSSPDYFSLERKVSITTESSEWKKLKLEADDFLGKTKDIRLYALYTRILIHTEKNPLIGLSKGLKLVHHCIENYWDCLYPEIDKTDPAEAFFDRNNALADFASYKDLILPLSKKINVLSIGLGNYTLDDLIILDAGRMLADKQPLQGLMPEEEKAYAELLEYFRLSLELAENIKTLYEQKSNEMFTEFNDHLLPMLQKGVLLNGGASSVVPDTPTDTNNIGTTGDNVPAIQTQGAINNREDIVKVLGLICDYYENNEPSSPIPLMIKRVIKMVGMNYREIFLEFQLSGDLDKIFGKIEK
jgi:type VI secretion system protein ImpA